MSPRDHMTATTARARKQLAYSIARAADAKGAKQERHAARQARIARKAYLGAMRLRDLLES